jgi:hypothetical protein
MSELNESSPHSVAEAVNNTLSDQNAVTNREPATELQFIWSTVAICIMAFMALVTVALLWRWSRADDQLICQFVSLATNEVSKANNDLYKTVSDQIFERNWKILDRLVLGGLMSMLTLIIGFVFGIRKGQSNE